MFPRSKTEHLFLRYASPSLYAKGLVLRFRSDSGSKDDSTVKLRPASAGIPGDILSDGGFKCEYDRIPAVSVYSRSLTAKRDNNEHENAASGAASPKKAFNKLQEKKAGPVEWQTLTVLGPVRSSNWELSDPDKISFELWEFPGSKTRFFKISFCITGAHKRPKTR